MKKILVLATISLMILTGCGETEKTTEKAKAVVTAGNTKSTDVAVDLINLHEDFLVDPNLRGEEYSTLQPKRYNIPYSAGLNIVPKIEIENGGIMTPMLYILNLHNGDNNLTEPQVISLRRNDGQVTIPIIGTFYNSYSDANTYHYYLEDAIVDEIISGGVTLYIGNNTTRQDIKEGESIKLELDVIESLKKIMELKRSL